MIGRKDSRVRGKGLECWNTEKGRHTIAIVARVLTTIQNNSETLPVSFSGCAVVDTPPSRWDCSESKLPDELGFSSNSNFSPISWWGPASRSSVLVSWVYAEDAILKSALRPWFVVSAEMNTRCQHGLKYHAYQVVYTYISRVLVYRYSRYSIFVWLRLRTQVYCTCHVSDSLAAER